MNVQIKESGDIKKLSIVDSKSGVDYINDFIGNTGALTDGQFNYNDDLDLYEATQENFDWWEKVSKEYEKADFAKKQFLDSIENDEKREIAERKINDSCNCDLENMAGYIMQAINELKKKENEQ